MLNWETSGKNAQDKACWDMEKMVVPDTGGGGFLFQGRLPQL